MPRRPDTKLLTVKEAAERMQVSTKRVQKLILDGRIRAERHGQRAYALKPRDVELFMERGRLTGRKGGRIPRLATLAQREQKAAAEGGQTEAAG